MPLEAVGIHLSASQECLYFNMLKEQFSIQGISDSNSGSWLAISFACFCCEGLSGALDDPTQSL